MATSSVDDVDVGQENERKKWKRKELAELRLS